MGARVPSNCFRIDGFTGLGWNKVLASMRILTYLPTYAVNKLFLCIYIYIYIYICFCALRILTYIPYHTIPYHTIPYHTIPYHYSALHNIT